MSYKHTPTMYKKDNSEAVAFSLSYRVARKNVNKQPSKSDRLPLIDELSLITKANNVDE